MCLIGLTVTFRDNVSGYHQALHDDVKGNSTLYNLVDLCPFFCKKNHFSP